MWPTCDNRSLWVQTVVYIDQSLPEWQKFNHSFTLGKSGMGHINRKKRWFATFSGICINEKPTTNFLQNSFFCHYLSITFTRDKNRPYNIYYFFWFDLMILPTVKGLRKAEGKKSGKKRSVWNFEILWGDLKTWRQLEDKRKKGNDLDWISKERKNLVGPAATIILEQQNESK